MTKNQNTAAIVACAVSLAGLFTLSVVTKRRVRAARQRLDVLQTEYIAFLVKKHAEETDPTNKLSLEVALAAYRSSVIVANRTLDVANPSVADIAQLIAATPKVAEAS